MRTAHRRRSAQVAVAVVLALVSVSCGTDDGGDADPSEPPSSAEGTSTPTESVTTGSESPTAEPSESSATPEPTGTAITTAPSDFGEVLWGLERQVVYIWELEPSDTPECYGDCAAAWPPVLTEGDPVAEGKVDEELLGTTKRDDGTTQVTYNGHPLYYYAHEGPGEVKCHNIETHGGLWWVITPAGDRAA